MLINCIGVTWEWEPMLWQSQTVNLSPCLLSCPLFVLSSPLLSSPLCSSPPLLFAPLLSSLLLSSSLCSSPLCSSPLCSSPLLSSRAGARLRAGRGAAGEFRGTMLYWAVLG